MITCKHCGKGVDTDFDVEHEEECEHEQNGVSITLDKSQCLECSPKKIEKLEFFEPKTETRRVLRLIYIKINELVEARNRSIK